MQSGSIDSSKLASGAVSTTKLAPASVDTSKLAVTGVAAATYGTSTQIPVLTITADGRITGASMQAVSATAGAVSLGPASPDINSSGNSDIFVDDESGGSADLLELQEGGNDYFVVDSNGDIQSNSVPTAAIQTGAVTSNEIADGAVDINELAVTGVTAGTYGTSTQIPVLTITADGRVTGASLLTVSAAGSAVSLGPASPDTNSSGNADIFVDDESGGSANLLELQEGGNDYFVVDSNGDIQSNSVPTAAIQTAAVTSNEIADGAVDINELAVTGVSAGTYGTSNQIPVLTITVDGRITSVSTVLSGAVSLGPASPDTNSSGNADIFVDDESGGSANLLELQEGGNDYFVVDSNGDIQSNSVPTAAIQTGAVTINEIASNTVVTLGPASPDTNSSGNPDIFVDDESGGGADLLELQEGANDYFVVDSNGDIQTPSVITASIADGAVGTNEIADANVTAVKMSVGFVDAISGTGTGGQTASCPGGTTAFSGGCSCSGGTALSAMVNRPDPAPAGGGNTLPTGWFCQALGSVEAPCTAYALCWGVTQ